MNILAIESSCDDLSWAIVQDGKEVLRCKVASQVDLHAQTGGVVPEVAAREHLRTSIPVLDEVMQDIPWDQIDAIACTMGPGLLGSLLVGIVTAQTLAIAKQKPLIPVHHIEGHLYANWLERDREELQFPMVALTVSGGHNDLYLIPREGTYQLLGSTLDDAAGEAFDKVSRMLGLGYPGGPAIERYLDDHRHALSEEPEYVLPRSWGERDSYTFSFSGLKSEVRRKVEAAGEMNDFTRAELADAFTESVVEVLATKAFRAAQQFEATTLCFTGGVSASSRLREYVQEHAAEYGMRPQQIMFPKRKLYSTDNAAMIAAAAYAVLRFDPSRLKRSPEEITKVAPLMSYQLA